MDTSVKQTAPVVCLALWRVYGIIGNSYKTLQFSLSVTADPLPYTLEMHHLAKADRRQLDQT